MCQLESEPYYTVGVFNLYNVKSVTFFPVRHWKYLIMILYHALVSLWRCVTLNGNSTCRCYNAIYLTGWPHLSGCCFCFSSALRCSRSVWLCNKRQTVACLTFSFAEHLRSLWRFWTHCSCNRSNHPQSQKACDNGMLALFNISVSWYAHLK